MSRIPFLRIKGGPQPHSEGLKPTQNDNNEHQRNETDIHDLIRFVEEKSVSNLWFLYSFNAEVLSFNKYSWIKRLIEGTQLTIILFAQLIFSGYYVWFGVLRGVGLRFELWNARKTLRNSICPF
jgi:hypothetical protein